MCIYLYAYIPAETIDLIYLYNKLSYMLICLYAYMLICLYTYILIFLNAYLLHQLESPERKSLKPAGEPVLWSELRSWDHTLSWKIGSGSGQQALDPAKLMCLYAYMLICLNI